MTDIRDPDTLRALASKRLMSGFASFEEQDWAELLAHADAWADLLRQQTERAEALKELVHEYDAQANKHIAEIDAALAAGKEKP